MQIGQIRKRYDVVVAGARCAGASAAMLLARAGLRVLVVDPARPGSDTLSTHALMRGAVLQLQRWGLLERVRGRGTPSVTATTFRYEGGGPADEEIRIPVTGRDGVEALLAPRRTVLDPVLQEAAREAGADVALGTAVSELSWTGGTVTGTVLSTPDGDRLQVDADLVVGADGVRSRVARLAGAPVDHQATHAAAALYGYWPDPGFGGYVWGYRPGATLGVIPTNGGMACVFTCVPADRFAAERGRGLQELHRTYLRECDPVLSDRLCDPEGERPAVRAFAGIPGFLRRSAGPGWALVGDAGYFRDPITAHGITDALRDAELLARAVLEGRPGALRGYQETRDDLVRGYLHATDRIASFTWDVAEVKALHLDLSREMKKEVALLGELGPMPRTAGSEPHPAAPVPEPRQRTA